MNTAKLYANVSNADAEVIRAVLPRDTVKRLARLMNAPFHTARSWLYREVSASRRRDLAVALLAEMDREDAGRSAARRLLVEWAGDLGSGLGDHGEFTQADRALPGRRMDADWEEPEEVK